MILPRLIFISNPQESLLQILNFDAIVATMKIAVLGAGMVGRAIVLDLAKDHDVTCFDLQAESLELIKRDNDAVHTVMADLSRHENFSGWLSPFDLVVTAVPGFIGYKTLEAVILAGKNAVDISFFPEDALQLDQKAKEKKCTIITDCGVAPGASNLIIGRYNDEMKIESVACYVGGLPRNPRPPFYYKAPFSPVDVIQEYIRPARLVENGKMVTKPALSEREILHFEQVGELEAFNTDGLRSLLHTMPHIPDMKEKTLRWPGHIDLVIALKKAGFFDTGTIKQQGFEISPLVFTSEILVNQWKLLPGEAEFTIMKLIIKNEKRTIEYDLYDEYDPITQTSSMARTTGYTCTAAVNLIARGIFSEKGVYPPELVGRNQLCFDFVMNYLKERNVNWKKTEK